nr:electron transporter RnfB [Fusobacterium sp.]
LEGYKKACDNRDKEKQEKLEKLATMTKKEELLKAFEEIKAGKVLEAPAGTVSIQPISASKEFIEKNKKMLEGYKEAFDSADKEKQEKLEKLATMTKKEELLKCFEEIKAGKIIPDTSTMVSTKAELEVKKETSKEVKPKEDKKEQKQEEVVEKVKEEKAEQKEMATEEEKTQQAASYCSVLGDGLCGVEVQGEMKKEDNPLTEILKEEKVEIPKTEEKIEEEKASASSNIYEYASHVSEIQEKLEPKEEIVKEQKEEKIEPPKTEEEKLAEEQAASYCSVLGDGLCGVEIQEEVKDIKDTLEEKLTEKMD